MVWYETFNDFFFITIGGAIMAFLGIAVRSCYKSKCKNVKLCCLEIQRDTGTEGEVDMENQRNRDVIPKYSDAGGSRSYNGGDSSKMPR